MNSLSTITPKLVKLVPMLGTDKEGEIVGTVLAIRRTLKSAGCHLHDRALVVERAGLQAVADQSRHEASSAPELKPCQLTAMHCIRAGQGTLRAAELKFLRGMTHWSPDPAEKQSRWLSATTMSLNVVWLCRKHHVAEHCRAKRSNGR